MSLGSLHRLRRLLGPAALITLACGSSTTQDGGSVGTSTGSADDGASDSTSGEDESSGDSGQPTTGSQDTSTTHPSCAIPLADVAQGIGGFALDGEEEQDLSGLPVSGAGDVNGDGLADFVVAASSAGPNAIHWAGRTYVVFGKTDTDRVQLAAVAEGDGGFALDGEAEDDRSGKAVSGAGDVNGDGLADIVVGGPYADADGHWSGRAYVVFGRESTDKVSLEDVALGSGGFVLDGEDEYSHSGWSVGAAGDMNGDGLGDVVVGTLCGRVYVVFGKASTAAVALADVAAGIGGFSLDGGYASCALGRSVSGVGDVNGDGVVDVAVGVPSADPNGDSSGRTYVVFGNADPSTVSLEDVALGNGGFVLDGEAGQHESGASVSSAGDVNGDGLADVIVGAPGADTGGAFESGRAYVVFGRADMAPVELADVAEGIGGFAVDGEAEGHRSGYSVGGAGDVDGDGLADVIVGAHYADPNGLDRAGRTYVVFGKPDTGNVALADVALGTGGFALDGEGEDDHSGSWVSGGEDVNGDGISDVLVGAWGADPNGFQSGRTYVVFGGDFSCEGG